MATWNEWRTRAQPGLVWVALPVALMAASVAVLTPVWLNGDPETLGQWGVVNGGFLGAGVGVVVALAALAMLLGADLDSGRFPERLQHGENPRTIAIAQALVAAIAGCASWLVVLLSAGLGAQGDMAFRALTSHPAVPMIPPAYMFTVAALGPVVICVAVALAWCLFLAAESGTRAIVVATAAGASFAALLIVPEYGAYLVLHPLGGLWRLLSGSSIGRGLPGARHDNPTPYAISVAVWLGVLVGLAAAHLRRLGRDHSTH